MQELQELNTLIVDNQLNVKDRLEQLGRWRTEWQKEDSLLLQYVNQLNPNKKVDVQKAAQINNLRRRLRMKLVSQPLENSAKKILELGYKDVRSHLVEQFARLTKEEKLSWLINFLFIMTPDLHNLNDKISKVRSYRSLGQQRNFLVGGASGMGKTTYLNWLTSNYLPRVETERNYVPAVKVDAPVSNHTPKPLFQRIILECGMTYVTRDNEEDLLMLIALYFQKCGVEILIVDEIEHITRPEIRRRLLEVSNLTNGVPIICASCQPFKWVEGDMEVAGRWNDYFELKRYTNTSLIQLLAFIELILPFSKPSNLASYEVKKGKKTPSETNSEESKEGLVLTGTALAIQQWTGGVLRDIMMLIADAAARAIGQGLERLDLNILAATWQDIQTNQATDILKVLEQTA